MMKDEEQIKRPMRGLDKYGEQVYNFCERHFDSSNTVLDPDPFQILNMLYKRLIIPFSEDDIPTYFYDWADEYVEEAYNYLVAAAKIYPKKTEEVISAYSSKSNEFNSKLNAKQQKKVRALLEIIQNAKETSERENAKPDPEEENKPIAYAENPSKQKISEFPSEMKKVKNLFAHAQEDKQPNYTGAQVLELVRVAIRKKELFNGRDPLECLDELYSVGLVFNSSMIEFEFNEAEIANYLSDWHEFKSTEVFEWIKLAARTTPKELKDAMAKVKLDETEQELLLDLCDPNRHIKNKSDVWYDKSVSMFLDAPSSSLAETRTFAEMLRKILSENDPNSKICQEAYQALENCYGAGQLFEDNGNTKKFVFEYAQDDIKQYVHDWLALKVENAKDLILQCASHGDLQQLVDIFLNDIEDPNHAERLFELISKQDTELVAKGYLLVSLLKSHQKDPNGVSVGSVITDAFNFDLLEQLLTSRQFLEISINTLLAGNISDENVIKRLVICITNFDEATEKCFNQSLMKKNANKLKSLELVMKSLKQTKAFTQASIKAHLHHGLIPVPEIVYLEVSLLAEAYHSNPKKFTKLAEKLISDLLKQLIEKPDVAYNLEQIRSIFENLARLETKYDSQNIFFRFHLNLFYAVIGEQINQAEFKELLTNAKKYKKLSDTTAKNLFYFVLTIGNNKKISSVLGLLAEQEEKMQSGEQKQQLQNIKARFYFAFAMKDIEALVKLTDVSAKQFLTLFVVPITRMNIRSIKEYESFLRNLFDRGEMINFDGFSQCLKETTKAFNDAGLGALNSKQSQVEVIKTWNPYYDDFSDYISCPTATEANVKNLGNRVMSFFAPDKRIPTVIVRKCDPEINLDPQSPKREDTSPMQSSEMFGKPGEKLSSAQPNDDPSAIENKEIATAPGKPLKQDAEEVSANLPNPGFFQNRETDFKTQRVNLIQKILGYDKVWKIQGKSSENYPECVDNLYKAQSSLKQGENLYDKFAKVMKDAKDKVVSLGRTKFTKQLISGFFENDSIKLQDLLEKLQQADQALKTSLDHKR